MTTQAKALTFKSGICLYAGPRTNEYFIGTSRRRVALLNANAPAIYGAFKRGASGGEIAEPFSLTAEESSALIGELHDCEFFETLYPFDDFQFGTKTQLNIVDGYVMAPVGEGLCIEYDWDFIDKHTVAVL